MNKQNFISALREKLSGLPQEDIEERLSFYSEMIDDRIEEGLTEDCAVSELGSVDSIVAQIIEDTPLSRIAKEKLKPKRQIKTWEIVMLAVCSPIWLSLLISAFSIIISLYAVLWAVVISLWAAFGTLVGCSLGGTISGVGYIFGGNSLIGLALTGLGIICAGLSIFLFFGCSAATNGVITLAKKAILGVKFCFVGKEKAQ